MTAILALLIFLASIALVVGLVKPSIVKQPSRKRVGIIFGGAFILLLILFSVVQPGQPAQEATTGFVPSSNTVNTTATSSVTTPQETTRGTSNTTVPAQVSDKAGSTNLYPNPKLTPGDVLTTDAKIICVSGYTATVRSVSASVKNQVYAEYGVSYPQATGAYEVDHFIPLELGGSNDIKNLWLEPAAPTPGFHQKDQYENYAHKQACAGEITMKEAQRRMSTDWYKYWLEIGTNSSGASTNTSVQTVPSAPISHTSTSADVSGPPVKKSSSGICHAKDSTYYDKTTNYTPYDSTDACLASGGRLPK